MNIPSLDNKGLRNFGFITGVIIVLLFVLFFPWVFDMVTIPTWPWVLASLLWLPALLFPAALQPVYTIWMKVGHALGWVNTRIILGLLFYLLILPMGLIMRLFGKDPMKRKYENARASYRTKSVSEGKERLEKPF